MLLNKVMKKKNKLKDLNSQLKNHTNDLEVPMCALKETLVSCIWGAEIAKNQT